MIAMSEAERARGEAQARADRRHAAVDWLELGAAAAVAVVHPRADAAAALLAAIILASAGGRAVVRWRRDRAVRAAASS